MNLLWGMNSPLNYMMCCWTVLSWPLWQMLNTKSRVGVDPKQSHFKELIHFSDKQTSSMHSYDLSLAIETHYYKWVLAAEQCCQQANSVRVCSICVYLLVCHHHSSDPLLTLKFSFQPSVCPTTLLVPEHWRCPQCSAGRGGWRKTERRRRRRRRRREGGGERAHIHSIDGFPLFPHTLSLPDTSSAERPAGKGGSWERGWVGERGENNAGGWGRRVRGDRGRDRKICVAFKGCLRWWIREQYSSYRPSWFQSFQSLCFYQSSQILTDTELIYQQIHLHGNC